jgi:hypothetical protein
MISSISTWTKQHSPVVYFVLACAIPFAAVKPGWTQLPIPFAIHYLGSFVQRSNISFYIANARISCNNSRLGSQSQPDGKHHAH